ncbi:MAG: helix-turn-helix transcriptional regulator [Longimicrobiales bacterium]
MNDVTLPRTYTAAQIGLILQIRTEEIYRMGARGEIPGRIRLGGRTRWLADAVETWLADGCPAQAA